MSWALPLAMAIVLPGCSKPVDPVGTYTFNGRDNAPVRALVLEVRRGGEYVLKAKIQYGSSYDIRGHWEKEDGPGPSIALHGVIWHGTVPEAGHGIWMAAIESGSRICLDGEGLECLVKNK